MLSYRTWLGSIFVQLRESLQEKSDHLQTYYSNIYRDGFFYYYYYCLKFVGFVGIDLFLLFRLFLRDQRRMTEYKQRGGSVQLVNCVCRQRLNPQEHAAMSATVSVCNNSASLIGFCGFPITPPDLPKSNGPLLNPVPADTHHWVLQCQKYHIARKKKNNLIIFILKHSQCVAAVLQQQFQTSSTKERMLRRTQQWTPVNLH